MMLAINTTLQLLQLRSLMLNMTITGTDKGLSAYIIPLTNSIAGSYIPTCEQRLQYVSGFSGSVGTAVITHDLALLWTDGRYYTQAGEQLDRNWNLMKDGLIDTPSQADFLTKNLTRGSLIGIDPTLYSKSDWDTLHSSLKLGGQTLVAVERNLVDLVWHNRPECPLSPVFSLGIAFTGRSTAQKLIDIRAEMMTEKAEAIVLSELDEIAWLLNLRGADISSASLFISYLIILENKFMFFINSKKITDANITLAIVNDGGEIYPYEDIGTQLSSLVNRTSGKIWFSNTCNYALVKRVPENRQILKLTPIALLKAVKNSVEVEGMRKAHVKDAAAIIRFLQWLENALHNGENVTEISAADRLLEFKKQNENYLTTSFATISGSGSNGAIIHYRATPESNKRLSLQEMYLIDSGAIYRTTDITRTLHFGSPTDFQKECYTRVLKGQIAIATSKFPFKIRGSRLDAFARQALWNVGLDYNHGTGHGVGHALNVHEGPSYIRSYYIPDDQGLRANMFTSNEPGFYQEGEFGIRLENVIRVVNVTLRNNFQNIGFLGFEDFTFVPYRHNLIKTELLTKQEIDYLNDYQRKTREIVGEFIRSANPSDLAYTWLIKETEPFNL